jgi:hypothetical protein
VTGSKKPDSDDPFEVWRDWLNRSERQLNTVLNQVTSSDQFNQASSRLMETLLVFQRGMNESTQRYFSVLNVPTRTDILSLGERLGAIEERLESLEAAVRDPSGSARRTAPRPARTRRPPTGTAAPAEADPPAPAIAEPSSEQKSKRRTKSRASAKSAGKKSPKGTGKKAKAPATAEQVLKPRKPRSRKKSPGSAVAGKKQGSR